MSQVNINNLRTYLTKVVATQIKTTQPAYTNQFSTVNAVASASSMMNINPKTGTITLTGSIVVTQPVINPIPINTTTAFISTNNNQVSVTSKGDEDSIIVSKSLKISNIEDVTNSGYTKNNSYVNLYDNISSNYWNPQLNLSNGTGTNIYLYTLNYTFDKIYNIYKFSIINNLSDYSGFTNIKLYETLNPSNYVNITPFVNYNGYYNNQTIALLLDDNSSTLFNTNKISAQFTLNPQIKPNNIYQYGKCNGIMYNNGKDIQIRLGNFICSNSDTGSFLEWTVKEVPNLTTDNGTLNINNNYLSSTDGNYQIVYNTNNYSYKLNGSTTFTKVNFNLNQMTLSDDGIYAIAIYYNSITNISNIFYSSDSGQTLTQNNIFSSEYGIQDYLLKSSNNGKYVLLVQKNPRTSPGNIYNYTTKYNGNYGQNNFSAGDIQFEDVAFFTEYTDVINTFATNNGNFQSIINHYSNDFIPFSGDGMVYFCKLVTSIDLTKLWSCGSPIPSNRIFSIETNYNDIPSIDGKYKTCFGYFDKYTSPFIYINGVEYRIYNPAIHILGIFYTLDDSNYTFPYNSTYISINSGDLFSDYYLPIINDQFSGNQFNVKSSIIKISPSGENQILHVVFQYANYTSRPNMCITYYSKNYGINWSKSQNSAILLNEIGNIVGNNDFSIIQINGGLTYNFDGKNTTTVPITYISYDYGKNWTLNSSLNPATEFLSTNFFTAELQTNKTYFQIKDLNQNQVLGVSDNGFKMTKDLRVTNANGYILGGSMTIGPDEASSLLNDYTLNVDGTVSAKNLVILSDERFKNIINKIDDKESYDKLKELSVVKYNYKKELNKEYIGLIAQDVQKVYDDVVEVNKSSFTDENNDEIQVDNTYSINYNSLISRLISAVKYSQYKIELLENKINELKNN